MGQQTIYETQFGLPETAHRINGRQTENSVEEKNNR
jgi:hypothetical protein